MKEPKQKNVKDGGKQNIAVRKINNEENKQPIGVSKQFKYPAQRKYRIASTTLRTKNPQPWIEPAATRASTLRSLNRGNAPLRAKARGKIPDFITDSSKLPTRTIHPDLLEELRRQAKSPAQAPPSPRKAVTTDQPFVAGNVNREAKTRTGDKPEQLNICSLSSSSDAGRREKDEANLPDSAVPAPLSRLETHFIELSNRLIDRQRAITQKELKERQSRPIIAKSAVVKPNNKVHFQENLFMANPGKILARMSDDRLPPPRPKGILKDAQPSTSLWDSNRFQPLATAGDDTETDFDLMVRALTPGGHKNASSSITFVPHNQESVHMESPAAVKNNIKELERKNRKLIIENDFRRFLLAIKGMKRCSPKLLNPVLEALSELRNDDDSDTEVAGSEVGGMEVQSTITATVVQTDVAVAEKATLARASENGIHFEDVNTQVQHSYRDVLTSGLINGLDTCNKPSSDPTSHSVKKLNPAAPIFQSFLPQNQPETSTNPVNEHHRSSPAYRAEQEVYNEGNGLERKTHMNAKVGKYVPPALRGDHSRPSARRVQEPIWFKITADGSPIESAEPQVSHVDEISLQYPEPDVNDAKGSNGLGQLSLGSEDQQSQQDRIRKWVYDAAKPGNGTGVEPQYLPEYAQKMAEYNARYKYTTDDITLSNRGYEDSMPFELGQLPQLPMHWGPASPHLMQYPPHLQAGYPMLPPFPLVGPLIPVPGPPFLMDHMYQDSALQPLAAPLIPSNAMNIQGVPQARLSKEENAARIARSLDPAWRDRVLDRFASRFPMTGRAQSSFPVPPIQDLESQAAQIQQRLELLILQDKEKKASEKWLKSCQLTAAGCNQRVSASSSSNLIKFD